MKKLRQLWQDRRLWAKRGVIALGVLLGVHAMSLWAGSGRVIDEETGKPLAGVYVMAMWHASGFSPVVSKSVCYYFAISKSDEDGKYSLPTFSWNINPFLSDRQRYLEYYIAGYEDSPSNMPNVETRLMQRYKGTAEQRLRKFTNRLGYERCVSQGGRKEKLGPLYKSIYEEGVKIATTQTEKELAGILKFVWDSAVLPYDAEHRYPGGDLKQ